MFAVKIKEGALTLVVPLFEEEIHWTPKTFEFSVLEDLTPICKISPFLKLWLNAIVKTFWTPKAPLALAPVLDIVLLFTINHPSINGTFDKSNCGIIPITWYWAINCHKPGFLHFKIDLSRESIFQSLVSKSVSGKVSLVFTFIGELIFE